MSLEQALSYHMYIVVFNPEEFTVMMMTKQNKQGKSNYISLPYF